MGYLAAADATAMTAEEQARCLRVLERATAIGTAARTSVLGAFASGQGYSGADAEYSPRAWLIHKTGVTKGAAVSLHRVGAAGRGASRGLRGDGGRGPVRVGGQDRVPVDRTSCRKTRRDDADDKLVAAAVAGMSLPDLAELFGEIYERSQSAIPRPGQGRDVR